MDVSLNDTHSPNDTERKTTYLDIVASLPVPTIEQTVEFVDHVADNHSWYKHLPLFPPGTEFVCFLNPYAGWGTETTAQGVSLFRSETGDVFDHHSRLTTSEYQRKFGHWDYWVGRTSPTVFTTEDGKGEILPADIHRQWQCRLTAFLQTSHNECGIDLNFCDLEDVWDKFLEHTTGSIRPDMTTIDDVIGQTDADTARYLSLFQELSHASDSPETLEIGRRFIQRESNVQRKRLLVLLLNIRDACSTIHTNVNRA